MFMLFKSIIDIIYVIYCVFLSFSYWLRSVQNESLSPILLAVVLRFYPDGSLFFWVFAFDIFEESFDDFHVFLDVS